jgi:hypothetical protein
LAVLLGSGFVVVTAHAQTSDALILQTLRSGQDPEARRQAALRLGKREAAMALEPLLRALLADRSAAVRLACVQSLGELAAPAALSALRAATHDEDPAVKAKAAAVAEKLAKLSAAPIEKLVVFVSSPTGKAAAPKVTTAIEGLPQRLRSEFARELANSPDIEVHDDPKAAQAADNAFAIETTVSSLSRRTTSRGELEVSFDINVVISLLPGKRVVGIVTGGASTFSPRNTASHLSKSQIADLEGMALSQSVQAATENLVSFLRGQRKPQSH